MLKNFNKLKYGHLSLKVATKRKELEGIQLALLSFSPNREFIEKEKRLSKELHDLLIAEESFFRQKSKIQWIQEGDQNTRFF